ncbi:TPA: hypothetical protein NHK95_006368 [Pseudomonas aeruginosa]|nr:hypothetical protein [Pseudomonas aeruginosa]
MNTWVSFQSAEQPLLGQFSVSGNTQMELGAEQLHALVLGLPWQRVGQNSAITLM